MTWAAPGIGLTVLPQRESPAFFQIAIPEDLASIEEIYQAPPKEDPQLILYIQNAHGSYEAQMKIKKLLEYLNQKYGFKLIFVEGAVEKLNREYLRLFPDAENNEKLADYLTKQGELTGAEYYLMDGPDDVEAVGIEEAELYRGNYEAFKAVQSVRSEIDSQLDQFERKMQALASRIFTSDTLRLMSEWKKFENGHRDFLPYVRQLAQESRKVLGLDLESLFSQVEWPMITRLLVLQSMEKDLNRIEAEKEKARLVAYLEGQGISGRMVEDIRNLGEKTISVARLDVNGGKTESMPRDLLERLVEEAGPKGFQFHDYPAFSLYAGYLILQSELESRKLFDEIELLFKKILDEMTPSEMEKNLVELYRDHELLRKLFHLELTRSEWGRVFYRREWIEPKAMVRRLGAIRGDTANEDRFRMENNGVQLEEPGAAELSGDAKMTLIGETFVKGFDFYNFARQRETVFRDRMRKEMAERKIDKAVLITGGFHTDGVKDLLREDEVSYGVLMPRLTQSIDNVNYLTTMMENRQTIFDVANLEKALRQSIDTLVQMGRSLQYEARSIVSATIESVVKQSETLDAVRALLANFAANPWVQPLVRFVQTDQPDTYELALTGDGTGAPIRYELRISQQTDGHLASSLRHISEEKAEAGTTRREFGAIATIVTAGTMIGAQGTRTADAKQPAAVAAPASRHPYEMTVLARNLLEPKDDKDIPLDKFSITTNGNVLQAFGLSKTKSEEAKVKAKPTANQMLADTIGASNAFTVPELESFRKACLITREGTDIDGKKISYRIAGTKRAFMEFLNLFREIRYLAHDEVRQMDAAAKVVLVQNKDEAVKKNKEFELDNLFSDEQPPKALIVLSVPHMIRIAGQIWELMNRPPLNVIAAHKIFNDRGGENDIYRILMRQMVRDALVTGEVPIVNFSQPLVAVGVQPGLSAEAVNKARLDEFMQIARRAYGPVKDGFDEDLIRQKVKVSELQAIPPITKGQIQYYAEHPEAFQQAMAAKKADLDIVRDSIPPHFAAVVPRRQTVGHLYLSFAVAAWLRQTGETMMSDPAVSKTIEAAHQATVQWGKTHNWIPLIEAEYPGAGLEINLLPISPGTRDWFINDALVVVERLLAALQFPTLYESYVSTVTPNPGAQVSPQQRFYWHLEDIKFRNMGILAMIKEANTKEQQAKTRNEFPSNRGSSLALPVVENLAQQGRRELRTFAEELPVQRVFVNAAVAEAYAGVRVGSTFTVPEGATPELTITALAGGIAPVEDTVQTLTAFGDLQIQQAAAVPENENLAALQANLPGWVSSQPGNLIVVTRPAAGLTEAWIDAETNQIVTTMAANQREALFLIVTDPGFTNRSAVTLFQRVKKQMMKLFGVDLGSQGERLTVLGAPKHNVLAKRISALMSKLFGKSTVILAEGDTVDDINVDIAVNGTTALVKGLGPEDTTVDLRFAQRAVAVKLSQTVDAAELDQETAEALQMTEQRGVYKVDKNGLRKLVDRIKLGIQALARILASA